MASEKLKRELNIRRRKACFHNSTSQDIENQVEKEVNFNKALIAKNSVCEELQPLVSKFSQTKESQTAQRLKFPQVKTT